jgi:hypothetical protein
MKAKKRSKANSSICVIRKPCPAAGTGRVGELVCYRCRIEHLAELISRAQPLLKNESNRIKNEVARLKIADTPRPLVHEQVLAARAKDKTRRTLEEFNEWNAALWDKFIAAEEKRLEEEATLPPAAVLSTIPGKVLEEISTAAVALADYHKKSSRWAWREFKKCAGCGEDITTGTYCTSCRRKGEPARLREERLRERKAIKNRLSRQRQNKA